NRLTHTIEVAQISRTIAAQLGLNTDLVEALALEHDLGHPPFGHSGEKALDTAMRQHGLTFDHNLHALRIVEDFEPRYAAFRGLNLTFEVREGIIKHSHDYDAKDYPELAEYLLDQRPPLEAQLIDLTDEIAYNTADLDDGYEARLLTVEQIADNVDLFKGHYNEAKSRYPKVAEKLVFNEALKSIFNGFVGDLITNTAERVRLRGCILWKMSAAGAGGLPHSVRLSKSSAAASRPFSTRIFTTVWRWLERRKTPSASPESSLLTGWRSPTTCRAPTVKKPGRSHCRASFAITLRG